MNQDERMYVIKNQKIVIEKELDVNRILDIGGGGEGVIGLCYGDKVIAIDRSKDELEESPDGPLKIVMDASKLSFLENSFDAVTSFFTLMYISIAEHEKIFNEIYRVLNECGKFILWDATIPKYDNSTKDIFVIHLEVSTPDKRIETGYGVLRKDKEQDIQYFINMGLRTGFKVIKEEIHDHTFKIIFQK
ncbi:class I SAM-dependent methyltransferase [Brassicibacter mesophilus]|uniref:class I SAM-dependent methyltransferase n=1 Tax=Brassicibacter mesophilus TaxID=745119 RepID=UPI003D1B1D8F